jgi:hypothetical protein
LIFINETGGWTDSFSFIKINLFSFRYLKILILVLLKKMSLKVSQVDGSQLAHSTDCHARELNQSAAIRLCYQHCTFLLVSAGSHEACGDELTSLKRDFSKGKFKWIK